MKFGMLIVWAFILMGKLTDKVQERRQHKNLQNFYKMWSTFISFAMKKKHVYRAWEPVEQHF